MWYFNKKQYPTSYKSLARRLIISTILFSSLITFVITAFQLYQGYRYDLELIDSHFEQIQSVHLESIINNLWLADKKETIVQLEGILKIADIQYLEIKEGDNIWITVGKLKNKKIKTRNFTLTYVYKDKVLNIGTLKVVASLENAYQRVYDKLWVVLVSNGIKTSLVALFIFILFSKMISRHLTKISNFALENNSLLADETLRLDRKRTEIDELDVVVSAINDMRHRLSEQVNQIHQQKQYLSQTLNSIGDAVITTDKEGFITAMNPVAQNLTGWGLDEALGRPIKAVFDIVDASTRENIKNPVDKVLATGETVYLSNHTTLLSKNATEYQIADSAAPILDNDKQIQGMVLVFNDVTEAYALRQEREYILNNMVDGIFTLDEKGIILSNNKSSEQLFDFNADEMIGHYFKVLIPEFVIDQISTDLTKFPETKNVVKNIKGVRKNGESFPLSLLVSEMPKSNTQSRRYIATCHDLTLQEKQEEQIRRSQKMDALGKLTGGVAHDYNNMLGVIMGYSELLKLGLQDDPKLIKYIDEIHHAGERGTKLTKKLLSFSRLKQSDAQSLNVNTVLQNQEDMLIKTLTVRIKIVMELDTNLWPVKLESGEFEDVILNLSINAMHAMEKGGQLTFTSSNKQFNDTDINYLELQPGDYVLLSVTDTGIGMDEMTRNRMFDPFFSTKGEKGTGLGLSQVYGFMQRSGGNIKVYSEPGHGTRIDLYFPRFEEKSDLKPITQANKLIDYQGDETIMVVDDEPALVNLAFDILISHGYRVITSDNAKQALLMLEHESVDMVLSDVIMPGIDGYQLAKQVQQTHPHISILLCSGFEDNRHVEIMEDSSLIPLMHKPYTSEVLLKRIRETLDSDKTLNDTK